MSSTARTATPLTQFGKALPELPDKLTQRSLSPQKMDRDLGGSEQRQAKQIAEVVQYSSIDREY